MNWRSLRHLRLLLLPIAGPAALLWALLSVFLILIPCEIIGLGLIVLGYDKQGDAIMDWATDNLFTAPWKWHRA